MKVKNAVKSVSLGKGFTLIELMVTAVGWKRSSRRGSCPVPAAESGRRLSTRPVCFNRRTPWSAAAATRLRRTVTIEQTKLLELVSRRRAGPRQIGQDLPTPARKRIAQMGIRVFQSGACWFGEAPGGMAVRL